MKLRVLAVLVLSLLMIGLLSACKEEATKPGKSTAVTPEKAQEIALNHAGFSQEDVLDIHTHSISYEGVPCYSIHINVEGAEYEYVVAISTGEILYIPDIL